MSRPFRRLQEMLERGEIRPGSNARRLRCDCSTCCRMRMRTARPDVQRWFSPESLREPAPDAPEVIGRADPHPKWIRWLWRWLP